MGKNYLLKGKIIETNGTLYRFAARIDRPPYIVSQVVTRKRKLPEEDQRTWAALLGVDNYTALFGDAEKS